MSLNNVLWATTNEDLIIAVVKAAKKNKLTFKCPFFETTHDLSPIKKVDEAECRFFIYRGYSYFIAWAYNDKWKCNFWTLGMVSSSSGRDTYRKIIVLNDDMNTFVRLNFAGKTIGISTGKSDGT